MDYKEFIEYCDSDNDFIISLSKNPVNSMYDSVFIRYIENQYGISYPINAFNEFTKVREFCEERKKDLIEKYHRSNTKLGHLMLVKTDE